MVTGTFAAMTPPARLRIVSRASRMSPTVVSPPASGVLAMSLTFTFSWIVSTPSPPVDTGSISTKSTRASSLLRMMLLADRHGQRVVRARPAVGRVHRLGRAVGQQLRRRRLEHRLVRVRRLPGAAPMLTNGTGVAFIVCVPIVKFTPCAGASPLAPVTVTSYVIRSEYWSDVTEDGEGGRSGGGVHRLRARRRSAARVLAVAVVDGGDRARPDGHHRRRQRTQPGRVQRGGPERRGAVVERHRAGRRSSRRRLAVAVKVTAWP